MAAGRSRAPARGPRRPPVLLIPGFMAGDASLTLLAGWLRRRGATGRLSGIRPNAGRAGGGPRAPGGPPPPTAAAAGGDRPRPGQLRGSFEEPAIIIGQSRGG